MYATLAFLEQYFTAILFPFLFSSGEFVTLKILYSLISGMQIHVLNIQPRIAFTRQTRVFVVFLANALLRDGQSVLASSAHT